LKAACNGEESRKLQAFMTEEKKDAVSTQVKTAFVGDANLPTHYVNMADVRAGREEFYLTLGTAIPSEITNSQDLEGIDHIDGCPLFRCAVSRTAMKQIIDLATVLYENQTRQIEQLQLSGRKVEEHDNDNSRSS
jgi:hypothetical protein